MTDTLNIRPAIPADLDQGLALLPLLADFDVPKNRNPKHLWEGDAQLLRDILDDQSSVDSFCHVVVKTEAVERGAVKTEAVDSADSDTAAQEKVLGLVIVTMRHELMSHAPSAHLEAIVVSPDARGQGLGRKLLAHTEEQVRERGAQSLSLHVFANNHRARRLYDQEGFDSELIRATKWLE